MIAPLIWLDVILDNTETRVDSRGIMQQLSIGAVEELTQIPAHTLRKWESRHGIAVPARSESGRRVYSPEQVEHLKLVKALVDRGHSLAHLAQLEMADLRELAGLHETGPAPVLVRALGLVGPNVAGLLIGSGVVRWRHGGELAGWESCADWPDGLDGMVVESDTLPPGTVDRLLRMKSEVAQLLVVYRFAPRQTLRQLEAANVVLLQGPVKDEDIYAHLERRVEGRGGNGSASTGPPHRFSAEELARIAALSPGIACECPNHIARLLMDISSFEQYSRECIDTDPSERALHESLSAISAQARALFEDALLAVAKADGLAVNMLHD